jgi:DNA-binding transcriptional LysR family regulator
LDFPILCPMLFSFSLLACVSEGLRHTLNHDGRPVRPPLQTPKFGDPPATPAMPLDAHYLEVFKAVLSECSMSQAAARLRTSASNVKRIVDNLERELGVPLFNREARGRFQPTSHAARLDREIIGFMGEMEALQECVSQLCQTGRVLKIGARRWLCQTAYFVRMYNLLRQDSRVKIAFERVAAGEERMALESGACDIYVGFELPQNKRLATVELPTLPRSFGSLREWPPEVSGWRDISWGLLTFPSHGDHRHILHLLEQEGAGLGRALELTSYRKWLSRPDEGDLDGVIAPEPATGGGDARLQWETISSLPGLPIMATFLANHPYGFLEQALGRVASAMTSHALPI